MIGWLVPDARRPRAPTPRRHFGAGADGVPLGRPRLAVRRGAGQRRSATSCSCRCRAASSCSSFLLGLPLLLLERFALRKVVHRMRTQRPAAAPGDRGRRPSGISEVVDSLTPGPVHRLPGRRRLRPRRAWPSRRSASRCRCSARVGDTRRLCNECGADTVLVARGGYGTSHELRRIAWDLEGSSIDLVVVPSLTDVAGPRIHMRPVAGLPLLHLEQPQAGEAGGLSKRAVRRRARRARRCWCCAPLLLVVAAVVKLQDGGPVLFRQTRVGRDGRAVRMLKFRSMVVDAEQRLAELQRRRTSATACCSR